MFTRRLYCSNSPLMSMLQSKNIIMLVLKGQKITNWLFTSQEHLWYIAQRWQYSSPNPCCSLTVVRLCLCSWQEWGRRIPLTWRDSCRRCTLMETVLSHRWSGWDGICSSPASLPVGIRRLLRLFWSLARRLLSVPSTVCCLITKFHIFFGGTVCRMPKLP